MVADVRVDIDHLDEAQVLRLAQYYFAQPPLRDFGDSRRGEPGGPGRRQTQVPRPEPPGA